MIVRTLKELRGTDREVLADNWTSWRFLLKKEGMGFSFHYTLIRSGTCTIMEYKNHLEAVFCAGGQGELEVLPDGPVYEIEPGTLYALDQHDRHILRARSDLHMLCVFNPPLVGPEVHDGDGVYPLLEDDV